MVKVGTARVANLGEVRAWGKTGTTENYGDAWFVGATDRLTVAVWVGYPDQLKAMETEYRGQPVAGGTYPAQIWHDFMLAAVQADQQRVERECAAEQDADPDVPASQKCIEAGLAPDPAAAPAPVAPEETGTVPEDEEAAPTDEEAPDAPAGDGTEGDGTGGGGQAPPTPAPAPPTPGQPAPAPAPPPSGGAAPPPAGEG